MSTFPAKLADLLRGPLLETAGWPIPLAAVLDDLGRSFLPKGRDGRGYRAVARNGRILLASDRPVAELAGQAVCMRLQTWHRRVLPQDPPTPRGILLVVRGDDGPRTTPIYEACLVREAEAPFALALDVGGRLVLVFRSLPR